MEKLVLKVSVITPLYNHKPEYVRACLESLYSQTLKEIEFILIDNGATEEIKELIEEYIQKDSRFKVIHFDENQEYGKAMNAGLKEAKGEYIGVVESDDWIEPDMYEKLYGLVKKSYADVIRGAYFEFNLQKETYINKFPIHKLDRKLMSLLEVPQFLFGHVSHWSAIYKREMIVEKNILFNTDPNSVPDISFMYKIFLNAKSIYISPAAFYHYRMDNPNSTINAQDKMAWNISEEQKYITKYMAEKNLNQQFWDLKISQEFDTRYYNYYNRCKKTKFTYLKEFSKIFKEYINTGRFSYSKLDKMKRKECKFIVKHPILYYIKSLMVNLKYTTLDIEKKYFGIFKIKHMRHSSLKKFYLFGIQIYYTYSTYNDKFTEKIFSVKNDRYDKHKILTLFGLRIKFKKRPDKYKILLNKLDQVEKFQNTIYREIMAQNAIAMAQNLHKDSFAQYKNAFKGKDIVIVACGPTVNQYKPIKDAVHIGINRAFMYDKVKLDFLFVQDYLADEEQMTAADNYRYGKCKKFYGIIPEMRRRAVAHLIKKIPYSHIINANASEYIMEDKFSCNWAFDILNNPIGDFGGCVFSALQFALYTNPRRIYLVGCDCSEYHFHDEHHGERGISLRYQYPSWEYFKGLSEYHFPSTEIVSINPVGLKHLFNNAYINETGELIYE